MLSYIHSIKQLNLHANVRFTSFLEKYFPVSGKVDALVKFEQAAIRYYLISVPFEDHISGKKSWCNIGISIGILIFQALMTFRWIFLAMTDDVYYWNLFGDTLYVIGNHFYICITLFIIGYGVFAMRLAFLIAELTGNLEWCKVFIPMINGVKESSEVGLTDRQYIKFKIKSKLAYFGCNECGTYGPGTCALLAFTFCGYHAAFNPDYNVCLIIIWVVLLIIWALVEGSGAMFQIGFFYMQTLYIRYRIENVRTKIELVKEEIKINTSEGEILIRQADMTDLFDIVNGIPKDLKATDQKEIDKMNKMMKKHGTHSVLPENTYLEGHSFMSSSESHSSSVATHKSYPLFSKALVIIKINQIIDEFHQNLRLLHVSNKYWSIPLALLYILVTPFMHLCAFVFLFVPLNLLIKLIFLYLSNLVTIAIMFVASRAASVTQMIDLTYISLNSLMTFKIKNIQAQIKLNNLIERISTPVGYSCLDLFYYSSRQFIQYVLDSISFFLLLMQLASKFPPKENDAIA